VGLKARSHPFTCCPSCEPAHINCSLVVCSDPDCGVNQKPVIPDGQCCGTCVDSVSCDVVECASLGCGAGFQQTQVDGYCCPICLPVDRCQDILCTEQACRLAFQSNRTGSCCLTCSLCHALEILTTNSHKRCDRDDNLLCSPAWTGPNCTISVPVSELLHVNITIHVHNRTLIVDIFDVLFYLLQLVPNLNRTWVDINVAGGSKRQSSTSGDYTASVTCPNNDPQCTNVGTDIVNGLAGSDELSTGSTTTTSPTQAPTAPSPSSAASTSSICGGGSGSGIVFMMLAVLVTMTTL